MGRVVLPGGELSFGRVVCNSHEVSYGIIWYPAVRILYACVRVFPMVPMVYKY